LEDRTLPSVLTVTNNNDDGVGSLRATIKAAQDGDTIRFDSSLTLKTITLTTGEISFDKGLDIEGLGTTNLAISGNKASRIFNIGPDASPVTIAGLTIENGQAPVSDAEGGAIRDDGASLTLTSDTLTDNNATGAGGSSAFGGALEVLGELKAGMKVTITNCEFTSNAATGGTGSSSAGFAEGGAIYVNAGFSGGLTFTVTGTKFNANTATGADGASIANDGGAAAGGAIAFQALGSGTPTLQLTDDTFRDDRAVGGSAGTLVIGDAPANGGKGGLALGGAVWIDAYGSGMPKFTLSTDTFANCRALGGSGGNGKGDPGGAGGDAAGGALSYTANFAASPTLTVNKGCTFTSNFAIGGNGGVGGNSPSTGANGGDGGNGNGGAVDADFGNSAGGTDNFTGDTFQINEAIGGNAGNGGVGLVVSGGAGGKGGIAFGGGLQVLISGVASGTQLSIADSPIIQNTAQGGNGGNGGNSLFHGGDGGIGVPGVGGGLDLNSVNRTVGASDTWMLNSLTVQFNVAKGGSGGGGGAAFGTTGTGGNGANSGAGIGGGIEDEFIGSLEIHQCTIAFNKALSGAGGTGGAAKHRGSDGAVRESRGGGIAIHSRAKACKSSDTNIVDNTADVGHDVLGTLGTC
jgi:hypothetical protein